MIYKNAEDMDLYYQELLTELLSLKNWTFKIFICLFLSYFILLLLELWA